MSMFIYPQTLLNECVATARDKLAESRGSVKKMFAAVEGGLSYKYHSSWGLVMQVIGAFFQVSRVNRVA